jgi:hypothetical protein
VTPSGFDPTFNDPVSPGNDGFLAALDMLPSGAARYGTATPRPGAVIGAEDSPLAGFPFNVTSVGGPPGASGLLLLGVAPVIPPRSFLGVALNVDISLPWTSLGVTSDSLGFSRTGFFLPPAASGLRLYLQYAWIGVNGTSGPTAWTSKGLALAVQ